MSIAETAPTETAISWPQLGSLEHILYFAKLSKSLKPKNVPELYDVLSEHRVAESWAYFIAQNETPKRGGSDHNVSLNTRHLHGYKKGPIIDAEFNYDPFKNSNNFVYVHGRPSKRANASSYYLRMHLEDDLELNTGKALEAIEYKDLSSSKYDRRKIFRTNTFPEYDEQRPGVFLSVLRTAASGLENFVNARDNF